jgi:hypothetical protein
VKRGCSEAHIDEDVTKNIQQRIYHILPSFWSMLSVVPKRWTMGIAWRPYAIHKSADRACLAL